MNTLVQLANTMADQTGSHHNYVNLPKLVVRKDSSINENDQTPEPLWKSKREHESSATTTMKKLHLWKVDIAIIQKLLC